VGRVKAALVVHRVLEDIDSNLATIVRMIGEAANSGADLVLLAEAALTGLINDDDPAHDLPLAQPIPGPVTDKLAQLARDLRIWLATGLLERAEGKLYDTAVLLSPDGEVSLKYRRIQPQWHGRSADPAVYCQGTGLRKVETPWGSFAFLICGDLFDDAIVARAKALRPDLVLFPFARCFDDGTHDQERWDTEEEPAYVDRVRSLGATTLMTNYLADRDLMGGAFGGAMAVAGDGIVMDSLPLGQAGILLIDLPSACSG